MEKVLEIKNSTDIIRPEQGVIAIYSADSYIENHAGPCYICFFPINDGADFNYFHIGPGIYSDPDSQRRDLREFFNSRKGPIRPKVAITKSIKGILREEYKACTKYDRVPNLNYEY